MIEILAGLLLMATQGNIATDNQVNDTAAEMPTDISELDPARFLKNIPFADRHNNKAERVAKAADCDLASDEYLLSPRYQ